MMMPRTVLRAKGNEVTEMGEPKVTPKKAKKDKAKGDA